MHTNYNANEVDDKIGKAVDASVTRDRHLGRRIDNEGGYYLKLAKRVAELENKLARHEVAAKVETSSCLDDQDIAPLARTFVDSLGVSNREQLQKDLAATTRFPGQVVRALKRALV